MPPLAFRKFPDREPQGTILIHVGHVHVWAKKQFGTGDETAALKSFENDLLSTSRR